MGSWEGKQMQETQPRAGAPEALAELEDAMLDQVAGGFGGFIDPNGKP